MCRELLNTNRKTANTPLKKRAKDLKRHLTKDIQIVDYLCKDAPRHVIREMHFKTAMRYQYTPIRKANILNMTSLSVDEDVEPPEFSFIAGRNAMPQPFLKCFLAKLNILLS